LNKQTGFTLLEVIVVMIILGVLATIAISISSKSKENSIDKEAIANLRLIQAAERTKLLIDGEYTAGADASVLNSVLRISLSIGASPRWNYKAVAAANAFTAKAQRTADDGRVKCMDQDDEEPYSSGCTW
jgi:prepilin-type N-terminal cleavage/methylation domain-containing protein